MLVSRLKAIYHGLTASMRLFKNWYSVAYNFYKGEDKIKVKLKDGSEGYCNRECVLGLLTLIAKYNLNIEEKLHFKDGKLYYEKFEALTDTFNDTLFSCSGWVRDDNGVWYNKELNVRSIVSSFAFLEEFHLNDYGIYDVSNKDVVDVGANIGDSAIYFVKKGARKVYSFEPLPSIYKIALENIRLNNMEDKVVLFNAGVSIKDDIIEVPSEIDVDSSIDFTKTNNSFGDVKIPVYSLEKILREIVMEPYLLKMDCEGCEADVILNSNDEVLKKFNKIVFEHHACKTKVDVKKLISKLESIGFECILKEVGPAISKSELGLVYCKKN